MTDRNDPLVRLRRAYDAYITAPVGLLSTTADDLRKAAKAAGWAQTPHGPGPKVWTEKKLGVE